jgi:glycosyltransferase involved in cell wall biosynthesis
MSKIKKNLSSGESKINNFQNVTVVIPAYNEELAIQNCLRELRRLYQDIKIILVNDGSTDGTMEKVKVFEDITVISHTKNQGYGAALKTGIKQVKTPYMVWFDSDGQHQAEDIESIVKPVIQGECDANLGFRKKGSAYIIKRAPGKAILKLTAQLVARQKIPDLNCGFRCFSTKVIKRYLHLLPNGFSASSTSTLIMIRRGYRVCFTPIHTGSRLGESSVKIFRDGFKTLNLIFRLFILFDSILFFSVTGLIQIFMAALYSFYMIMTVNQGTPTLGAIGFISGVLTFFIGILSAQINALRHELFEKDNI